MSNPTLTVGELPEGTTAPHDDPTEYTENLYDSLDPPEVSYMYKGNVPFLFIRTALCMCMICVLFVALKQMYFFLL